jgi:hypothetical protein
MGKPTKLHDVQKLAGRVAALSRFVARLGEKALPFYALMKKSDDKFEWTEEDVVVVKQHMPWDGLNGGRTRCWWIRERGTS